MCKTCANNVLNIAIDNIKANNMLKTAKRRELEPLDKVKQLKVAQLKEQLPHDWLKQLLALTDKKRWYLSKMVNKYQTRKPEWQTLLKILEDQKATTQNTEERIDQVLA